MKEEIRSILTETASLHSTLCDDADLIERMAQATAETLQTGGALYVMGNGGSAASSQHLAGELVGRFLKERAALPCQAFTADTSLLTAIANDYTYENVFLRQVEGFVGEGDAVLGISTSGASTNINVALKAARDRGALTLGLSGRDGGGMPAVCDICLVIRSAQTPRIQEAHLTVIHILCDLIEKALFPV